MRYLFTLILVILIIMSNTKHVLRTVKLKQFAQSAIFLTKMRIGAGNMMLQIRYTKTGQDYHQNFFSNVALGIVNQSSVQLFLNTEDCIKKKNILKRKQTFGFRQQKHGLKYLRVMDLSVEDTWYFYLYICPYNIQQLHGTDVELLLDIKIMNNNSYFDQYDKSLWIYVANLLFWIFFMFKYSFSIISLIDFKNFDLIKILIFSGLIFLGGAYMYKLTHLLFYYYYGDGIHLFEVLYLIFKGLGQMVNVTLLIILSWGWSILHLNSYTKYLAIGVVAGLINLFSLILASMVDESQEIYHYYDTNQGLIIIFLRFVLLIIFSLGIIRCLNGFSSENRSKTIVRKIGFLGGCYLIVWPLALLIAKLTLVVYLQKMVVTLIEQMVHIATCMIIYEQIIHPDSAYRRLSLSEEDNPLGMKDYKNQ